MLLHAAVHYYNTTKSKVTLSLWKFGNCTVKCVVFCCSHDVYMELHVYIYTHIYKQRVT